MREPLRLREFTPARVALGRAGDSLPTSELLQLEWAHARARKAVHSALDFRSLSLEFLAFGLETVNVESAAPDRVTYLRRPDLGRRLTPESRARLEALRGGGCDLVIAVADGLSALAVERHAARLVEALLPVLNDGSWRVGPTVLVEQGRVAVGDEIGEALGAQLVLVLLGERPGLSSCDSLGAYLTWRPQPGRSDADRNCVSNIRADGLPYEAAAWKLAFLLTEARLRKLSGVALKEDAPALR